MPQTFHCPNCQASLDVDPASPAVTVRCPYCSSTVIVPEALRGAGSAAGSAGDAVVAEVLRLVASGQKIAAIKAYREAYPALSLAEAKEAVEALERGEAIVWQALASPAGGGVTQPVVVSDRARRVIGCSLLALLLVIGLSIVIPLVAGWFAVSAVTRSEVLSGDRAAAPADGPRPTDLPAATATPELAPVILRFGGQEGIGPGFFNDTRRLGVDGEGRIYTGDYLGGRVQVFDAGGAFQAQWSVGPADYAMIAMAVDRAGTVYLLERGAITRYDGLTGVAQVPPAVPGRGDFRSLAIAPDGSLVAAGNRRLVRFDAQGELALDLADPFAAITGFQTTHNALAVDGAGYIYLAGAETIYKFDPEGRLVDRIGSRGDGSDQFHTAPSAIAVDGRGRLFANDFEGIHVFDANGRHLALIELAGISFGMVVDDQNRLVVMDRNSNEVLVYDLSRLP